MDVETLPTRGDARREAILRVAREVFLKEGYAAASMSAIAARVGGSKGTLYNHFKSKEALFTAFLREACAAESDHAFDFSDYDGDVEAALRRLGGRFLRFVLSDTVSAVHRVVIAEGVRFPELGRTFYEIGPKKAVDRTAAFLERQMSGGRLRRADPRHAAEQLLDLYKAGLHQRRLWGVVAYPDETELDANVESAVAVFMAAYGPGQGASMAAA